jgi:prepilin-type N-terminal cleavage/methylation domain-containing protein
VKKSTRKFRGGFTLLEVLATLVLIGIILPAVMHGISLATIAAGQAAKVEAARWRGTAGGIISPDAESDGRRTFSDYPGYTWTSTIDKG